MKKWGRKKRTDTDTEHSPLALNRLAQMSPAAVHDYAESLLMMSGQALTKQEYAEAEGWAEEALAAIRTLRQITPNPTGHHS